ncbi:MAG: prepilin-type N-terminal cleavage/methylation domain-containing protein [Anaerovoracaceae bacterium]
MRLLHQRKLNNKGFTLIEMIVVVLIISIVAAVVVPGVASLLSSGVTKAASELNSICMRTRVFTMSAPEGSVFLKIYMENEKYYAAIFKIEEADNSKSDNYQSIEEPVFLGNDNLEIFELGGNKITGSNPLYVQFEKGSGAFKSRCRGVKISGRGRDVKLHFVQDTGRTYMESSDSVGV